MLFPRSHLATHSGIITVTRAGIRKHLPEMGYQRQNYIRQEAARASIQGPVCGMRRKIQAQSWDTVKDKVCLGPKLFI